MAGPLSHIRVLDLSRVLAAPWTRAEPRRSRRGGDQDRAPRSTGDDSRAFGPPWLKDAAGKDTTESAYFASANRGKKSVTVNLSKPEGQDIVRRIAAQCDVLLENYKVGDLARYGLGYEDLRKINPRLIYCSVTGFGQTGPYARAPRLRFHDPGHGGAHEHHRRARRPARRRSAEGGHPDRRHHHRHVRDASPSAPRSRIASGAAPDSISISRSSTRWRRFSANQGGNYLATGVAARAPRQRAPQHRALPDLQDGGRRHHPRVRQRQPVPQVLRSRRLPGARRAIRASSTNGKRVENRTEITRAAVGDHSRKRTTRDWVDALEAAGVPNGPINNLKQVFEEPQVVARGLRIELDHPLAGKVSLVRSPMRFSGNAARAQDAAADAGAAHGRGAAFSPGEK